MINPESLLGAGEPDLLADALREAEAAGITGKSAALTEKSPFESDSEDLLGLDELLLTEEPGNGATSGADSAATASAPKTPVPAAPARATGPAKTDSPADAQKTASPAGFGIPPVLPPSSGGQGTKPTPIKASPSLTPVSSATPAVRAPGTVPRAPGMNAPKSSSTPATDLSGVAKAPVPPGTVDPLSGAPKPPAAAASASAAVRKSPPASPASGSPHDVRQSPVAAASDSPSGIRKAAGSPAGSPH